MISTSAPSAESALDIAVTSEITTMIPQNSLPDQMSALNRACTPPTALFVTAQPMTSMPATQGKTMLFRNAIRASMASMSATNNMWT